jgi:Serine-threonine protein kinase 19
VRLPIRIEAEAARNDVGVASVLGRNKASPRPETSGVTRRPETEYNGCHTLQDVGQVVESMPLYYTAASSSKIRNSGVRKRNPVSAARRQRLGQRSGSGSKASALSDDDNSNAVDSDFGLERHEVLMIRLAPGLKDTSVVSILEHVPLHMFEDMPEKASGMNSVRIAEVLNYRLRMPKIVSASHVHALRDTPTATEREIASLIQSGQVCKVSIPGRGTGVSAVGSGLVLLSEWRNTLSQNGINGVLTEKYLLRLQGKPADAFRPDELRNLMKAGFLTGSSLLTRTEAEFSPNTQSSTSLSRIANAGSFFASGSEGAVATAAIENISGGSGAASRMQRSTLSNTIPTSHSFSLPNMGIFLRLLTSSRDHLVSLIAKSGPSRSTTVERLKERWEGGATELSTQTFGRKNVLPGKTKKWKDFYGLTFEWVLAECLGAGLVECFKTGSVGTGVRLI